MCNRYHPAAVEKIAYFRMHGEPPRRDEGHIGDPLFPRDIGPYGRGEFIRPRRGAVPADGPWLEAVAGQWGLIGFFAKQPVPPRVPGRGGPILTNNARVETVAEKPTFRDPWRRGQRCIVPAWSYVEPCWETGRNQWWRFRRADGEPWGLAGLWNTWTDPATGELHESYTMLTVNCDTHPLLRRMHRPDPARPETMQDKRAVVPLAPSSFDAWLRGTIDEAMAALTLPPPEAYDAGPEAVAPPAARPRRPPPAPGAPGAPGAGREGGGDADPDDGTPQQPLLL